MVIYMHDYFKIAVDEAFLASKDGNVPVGAVIVRNGRIISKSHNLKNSLGISVYHAEILCIIDACRMLGRWNLDDCEMYVTLKPCPMCESAIAESRVKNVYYLLDTDYSNNILKNISSIKYNKAMDSYGYSDILSTFFHNIRNCDVSRETCDFR